MNQRLASNIQTDFHIQQDDQKQEGTVSKVFQLATEYGVNIAFARLWGVPIPSDIAITRLSL